MKKWYYPVLISVIILVSFFVFSSDFYALLNSDDAVTILMIKHFSLPRDIYFWQQDRYGSIIPFLAQVPYKVFHIPPITSESIVHYLLLIAGYLALGTLLKSNLSRIILAIAWFFPPVRQSDLLRFNLGIEYSLIAIAIYLLNRVTVRTKLGRIANHLRYIAIILLLILSVWVSDLAAFTVALLVCFQVVWFFRNPDNNRKITSVARTAGFWYMLSGIASGILIIVWAKGTGVKSPSYDVISGFNVILQSAEIFGTTILDFLFFRLRDPLTSLYSWMMVLLALFFAIVRPRMQWSNQAKKWFLFFLIDGVLITAIILASQWAFLNGVARRYFVCSYISFGMAVLIALDNMQPLRIKKPAGIYILIAVLIGGAGTIYNLKYIFPRTLTPRADIAREFSALGECGIIADYWNSYIVSAVLPGQIVATAHDRSTIRNKDFIKQVLNSKNIYVIADGWLTTFPETLRQFNQILVKDGEGFRMGHCVVCKYQLKK